VTPSSTCVSKLECLQQGIKGRQILDNFIYVLGVSKSISTKKSWVPSSRFTSPRCLTVPTGSFYSTCLGQLAACYSGPTGFLYCYLRQAQRFSWIGCMIVVFAMVGDSDKEIRFHQCCLHLSWSDSMTWSSLLTPETSFICCDWALSGSDCLSMRIMWLSFCHQSNRTLC
jgi:hypothetical protein